MAEKSESIVFTLDSADNHKKDYVKTEIDTKEVKSVVEFVCKKGESSNYDPQYAADGETPDSLKIEDMEILEQFIDGNVVHERKAYIVECEAQNKKAEMVASPNLIEEKQQRNNLCDNADNQEIDLERHGCRAHLNSKKHRCHLCTYSSAKIKKLRKKKTKEKKFECHLCDFASVLKSALKVHIEAVHLKLKEHKCHLCDHASARREHLKNHIDSIHLNLKEHKCHLCDYASARKALLDLHIKSVHLNKKQHKCGLCNYVSAEKKHLNMHIVSVHPKNKCHLCDYASVWKQSLERHIKSVHLNMKQHECHLCSFSSVNRIDLKRHIDSAHLNVREHECHLCDYASVQKRYLKKHIESFHLNIKERKMATASDEITLKNHFYCCKNKISSQFVCVKCGNIFHSSCLKRNFPKIKVVNDARIICCEETQGDQVDKTKVSLELHYLKKLLKESQEKNDLLIENDKLLKLRLKDLEEKVRMKKHIIESDHLKIKERKKADNEDEQSNFSLKNSFYCCKNKTAAIFLCATCGNIFHSKCLERSFPHVKVANDARIICCEETQGDRAEHTNLNDISDVRYLKKLLKKRQENNDLLIENNKWLKFRMKDLEEKARMKKRIIISNNMKKKSCK